MRVLTHPDVRRQRSDAQEQLSPVHPEQYQPIAEQHGGPHQWLKTGAEELEEVRAQMDAKRI